VTLQGVTQLLPMQIWGAQYATGSGCAAQPLGPWQALLTQLWPAPQKPFAKFGPHGASTQPTPSQYWLAGQTPLGSVGHSGGVQLPTPQPVAVASALSQHTVARLVQLEGVQVVTVVVHVPFGKFNEQVASTQPVPSQYWLAGQAPLGAKAEQDGATHVPRAQPLELASVASQHVVATSTHALGLHTDAVVLQVPSVLLLAHGPSTQEPRPASHTWPTAQVPSMLSMAHGPSTQEPKPASHTCPCGHEPLVHGAPTHVPAWHTSPDPQTPLGACVLHNGAWHDPSRHSRPAAQVPVGTVVEQVGATHWPSSHASVGSTQAPLGCTGSHGSGVHVPALHHEPGVHSQPPLPHAEPTHEPLTQVAPPSHRPVGFEVLQALAGVTATHWPP
jgi:hypothetical protein